jgi:NADPH2:quinone reductase
LTSKEQRIKRANKLFDWISGNKITIAAPTVLNFQKEKAHDYLESRKSTGKIILSLN